MGKIEISVIIPFYNAEKYLAETLEALKRQSFSNVEFILVNDGSTDNSSAIAEQYCHNDERFRVIHKSNSGVYNARLEGIRQANGQYVAFCDSDDIPLPDMLANMCSYAQDEKADIVVCGFVREDMNTGKQLSKEMLSFGRRTYSIPEESYILPAINTAVWNKLFKREILIHALHFKTPPRVLEDMMFLCSLYPFVNRIAFLPEILYRYRVHYGGAMTYVKDNEIELIQKDMIIVRDYSLQYITDKQMQEMYDSIAFIHFGLSIVSRQIQVGMNKYKTIKTAKVFLKQYFPSYKKTGIGLIWNIKHHLLLFRPLVARYIFCLNLLGIFLSVYNWIVTKTKKEIKW